VSKAMEEKGYFANDIDDDMVHVSNWQWRIFAPATDAVHSMASPDLAGGGMERLAFLVKKKSSIELQCTRHEPLRWIDGGGGLWNSYISWSYAAQGVAKPPTLVRKQWKQCRIETVLSLG
jgi:hypothetical protein